MIPGLLGVLRICHCRELWCKSQKCLGSHIAVALAWANSCSSKSTPSLRTFICLSVALKSKKEKKKKKKKERKGRKEIKKRCYFNLQSMMQSPRVWVYIEKRRPYSESWDLHSGDLKIRGNLDGRGTRDFQ